MENIRTIRAHEMFEAFLKINKFCVFSLRKESEIQAFLTGMSDYSLRSFLIGNGHQVIADSLRECSEFRDEFWNRFFAINPDLSKIAHGN